MSDLVLTLPAAPPATARRPWFLALARRYVRRTLARRMDGVHVGGLDEARALAARGPVLFAPNHVAWWDPLLLVALDEALGTEGYALMDTANLRKLPFFGWLGAVPLQRGSAREDLAVAAALADRPRRALWIFPQGRQRPAHLQPLDLKPGVAVLARLAQAPVVPVSLAYPFRDAPEPAAAVVFGEPLDPGRVDLLEALEARIVAGLQRIDRFAEGDEALDTLIAGRGRSPQGGLGSRLLGGHHA